MDFKLSQKERMLLEDEKNMEETCTIKYKNSAEQANDPELKQLFNKLSAEEKHHYDMVDQLLQGQQPTTSQSKGSQKDEQFKQTSSDSVAKASASDKTLCSDLLATEKYVSSTYDTGIFESANSTVRQTLQQIQKEEQHHGEQLFQYMHSHGMYNVK